MASGKRRPRRRTAKEHGPDPVDLHVGRRVRLARELAGLTQVEVGSRLGMSFQVVQKYEQGEIRVSASRLYQLSALLAVAVEFFFDGLGGDARPALAADLGHSEMELVRAFRVIGSSEIQHRLLQLVRGMAEQQDVGGTTGAKG
jgi:transcriptional regulator with XRE-family HTH domain